MARTNRSSAKPYARTSNRPSDSAQKEDQKLREALERETIEVEDSVARIDNEIYHKELLRTIPWSLVLRALTQNEKKLFDLSFIEGRSTTEVAEILGTDVSQTRLDLNSLRAKIRNRVRLFLKEHKAENELLLTWQKIRAKGDRILS